ncbi:ABC transporter substrate-binding protein [Streptomyces triticirhizae]|uniref:ABC transporter substrate-binding protein n=1 Tax=Streptomyces triticirhizae TaxID=2483353 RepID=A0A3M2LAB4_9ACTN|nr:ABC transporter substrate-binding protein [Streptomyces triticirhizae]RMI34542.1 ABC transporter substrate-binding protein [Streptomyces triticirhizae]
MSGDSHTWVAGAAGPINTGSGHQYVIQVAMEETFRRLGPRARDPRAVARGQLRHLRARFVPPTGYARARRLLTERSAVAVSGPVGGGRRATAQMVLHELAPDGDPVHEVDIGEEENETPLDAGAVGRRARLLLDLSESDTGQLLRLRGALADFLAVVERREARLAVVVPEQATALLAADLAAHVARIDPPPTRAVLMRHLRQDGVRLTPEELDLPEVAAELAGASLARVAELARLVGEAHAARPDAGFAAWSREALDRATEDAAKTAAFLAGLPDGRRRALALTVATLHGARPEIVQRALDLLSTQLRHGRDARPRLDHADLTAELEKVRAKVSGPDGRVRFEQPGREEAVLDHFWTYYADLRGDVQAWVVRCVRILGLPTGERERVVDRFAKRALRGGEPERLLTVARAWTGTDPSQQLVPDATQALTAGLEHPRHGRAVRRLILEEVRRADLPKFQRLALTVVCSRVIAVHHPDQAMVRLHHLARRETRDQRSPAWEELRELVMAERRLAARLLHRLTRHIPNGRHAHADADRRLLLGLTRPLAAHPAPLRADAFREPLVRGWADALERLPRAEWDDAFRWWLTAVAGTADRHGDPLVEILAEAGAASPRTAGPMYLAARVWAHEDPALRAARLPVVDRLRRALDTAQGLTPPTPPEAPHSRPRSTENAP